ncbi:MAG: aminodeoxychorismate synthase, component I [Burkholderiales bacterium RIFCSPLOWO2_12_FULL_61_40]|nr:MAG: aminodeoxychorismate synthase, component I [Burkholderiales bacterium RIFCSPLOWO2_12_FULL_61_40]
MDAYSALIDFSDPAQPQGPRLRHAFGAARQTLVAHRLDQVRGVLEAVQAAAQQGLWCVGYLRYEAAPAFDAALTVHAATGPLAWFAVYDQALPWPDPADLGHASAAMPQDWKVDWQEPMARPAFDAAMDALHQAIAQGELYQVNFTAQMLGRLSGAAGVAGARLLFAALQRAQPGGYSAYLDTGANGQLLSVSPELFFDWHAGRLLARPMKGTARRGATAEQDAALADTLRTSAKERSENVMIVDLLRNDLSRLAEPHSVRVPRLFHVEALPTVWQMTSDVEARTRADCSLVDVFAALFPCGSVTGAPKVRAMQMIHALEPQPRGVYCGALGIVQPGGRATFNVPIRTVTLQDTAAQCGIGSGITAYADAPGEWQEWLYKQAFVQRASSPFSLLETLALVDGVVRDADAHLARMALAARHFGTVWDAALVQQTLSDLARQHPRGAWRVRLLLSPQGRAMAEAHALDPSPGRVRLQLAERALAEAHSEFVRFKTTRRAHYDAFAPTAQGVFDTLLWNSAGEITECTRGNIALQLDGRWVTPALHCGLLAGIGRANALREGRVVEAVVRVQDLPRVTALAFVNSLRGWIDAELIPFSDQ